MKFQFDAQQQYQLDGIRAVVDLFTGQPAAAGTFEWQPDIFGGDLLDRLGIANALAISDARILENLRVVQERNALPVSEKLAVDEILGTRNFTVEMETGTGKTYVYLRTILELHRIYGWKKFLIVVPSVAIREGVIQSIKVTAEHFAALYGNVPMDSWVYDSAQVSRLRQFAVSNQLQVLVMNIQAFDKKDVAVVHRESDRLQGRKPIEFIQQCQPVVIMDEPQNMESENARNAIAGLHPLLTLRYSATHRNLHNPVYRLDPVRAYDLRLVKRIEVSSVTDEGDFNRPFAALESVKAAKTGLSAKLKIDAELKSGVKRKTVTVKRNGDDLFALSGNREIYRGYTVTEINAECNFVTFGNGLRLRVGESQGGHGDAVKRLQIEETVREHFKKELAMLGRPQGERIKVLSLFFIDRVANYAEADGKIRKWFVEAYEKIAAQSDFKPLALPVDQVHNGYFATDKGIPKDSKEGKSTKADDEAYHLIMEATEKLLSPEVPLRFIFSHSALREGWDNPNVFQICTLRDGASEIRKRQEIGRGLRLPRIESGERCNDARVNRLTVVASESFADFARKLQTEFEEECGVSFAGRIANKRDRYKAHFRKGWELNEDFRELWDRIKHKTRYRVEFETPALVDRAAKMISEQPAVSEPKLVVSKNEVSLSTKGVSETPRAVRSVMLKDYHPPMPDVIGYLQRETELTRSTLAEILLESGRIPDALRNPQEFMENAAGAVALAKQALMVDGIKYERIAGQSYEMMLFESEEIEGCVSRMIKVNRSICDAIEFDSDVEKKFAEALNEREDIRLFIKLPGWFRVKTPLGDYNPDWAIVKQNETKVYLVRETKAATDPGKLRPSEALKITCGERHFQDCLGVDYKVVKSARELD